MSHESPADEAYINHANLEDDPTYGTMQVGTLQVEGIPGLTIAGTLVANDDHTALELFYVNDDGRNICLFSTVSNSDLSTQVDILVNAFLPELERTLMTAANGTRMELDDDAQVALNYLATKAGEYLLTIFKDHEWGNGDMTDDVQVRSLETSPQSTGLVGFSAFRNDNNGPWTWTHDSDVTDLLGHTMPIGELVDLLGLA